MFRVDGVIYTFQHLGIPTDVPRPNERFNPVLGLYTSDDPFGIACVRWHRFTPDSPLHPLLKVALHPVFRVSDLDRAIAGKDVILGPYAPVPGYRVAAIVDDGMPVELIETELSDQELWRRAEDQSALHSDDLDTSARALVAAKDGPASPGAG